MSKVDLIDSQFDLGHHFEAAVLCTYGLDLNFLENYLLTLRGLGGCNTISLFVDATTYDEFASGHYAPRHLNRRYLVTPIRTAGVFHVKLYILASPRKTVITVGSANLTREGIAGNLELITTVAISEDRDEFAPLLRDALQYVRRLAEISGSEQAIEQVGAVADACAPLAMRTGGSTTPRLIHNLDQSILDIILDEFGDGQARQALVLSPFYDAGLIPLAVLHARLPGCPVRFYIQQRKSNFPIDRFAHTHPHFTFGLYRELERYLHGKAIVLEGDTDALVYTGSANFTRSALLKTARQGNYEIGLLGRAPVAAARDLLQPFGVEPAMVNLIEEIEVDTRKPPAPTLLSQVNCLIEAIQDSNDTIHLRLKPDISLDVFRPQRYRLVGFSGEMIEGPYSPGQLITRDRKARRMFQGIYGVQLVGKNNRVETVESNLVWVIYLDKTSGNAVERALRRVATDPSQLMQILRELAAQGDERELMLFLAQFDIPHDLVTLGATLERPRNLKSKGNLVGRLPFHSDRFFSLAMLQAFDKCISRLLSKMKKHCGNVHTDTIDNLVMLYSSVLTLVSYLNEWARMRYESTAVITKDDWSAIRDCYDMLMRYSAKSWNLVWDKNGYRNAVNAQLELRREEAENVVRFENLLLTYYNNSPAQFADVLEAPLKTFADLHTQLQVSTPAGRLVIPKIFPTDHPDLQPESRAQWTQRIGQTRQQLSSAFQPAL